MDPYRGELVRVEKRALVAEPEPAPRGVRVWAWSDGTLRMRLRFPDARRRARMFAAGVACVVGGFGSVLAIGPTALVIVLVAAAVVLIRLATYGLPADVPLEGEQIELTPAAISWRTKDAVDTRALADVSTVVVTGAGADARLDLQFGRERLQLADGLGYDEATLRWIAQRLRRAIEAAR